MKKILIFLLMTCLAYFAQADNPNDDTVSVAEINATFGWDFDEIPIITEEVAEGLYVLFGAGGNIAVSVGSTGVLIVDNMFPEMVPKIEEAIKEVGGGAIDFAVNTHWHFDHAHGNLKMGPDGTWIVAHENSLQMNQIDTVVNIVRYKIRQEAYPQEAQPVITFDHNMRFHFNDGAIDLVHAGPAHTAGDTAVIFRKQNAVHMGDVFNNTGYPFIDADSGGSISGMIDFCETVLQELDEETIVIPGHGVVTDVATMRAYIAMLKEVQQRVAALIAEGKTKEEVIAAKVTSDFDETYGPEDTSLGFIDRVFTSLTASSE